MKNLKDFKENNISKMPLKLTSRSKSGDQGTKFAKTNGPQSKTADPSRRSSNKSGVSSSQRVQRSSTKGIQNINESEKQRPAVIYV